MRLSVYMHVGAALLLAGGIAAPVFYFVAQSVPLVALALAAMLLGTTSMLLSRSLPGIPPQAAEVLLQTGLENTARLLEEIGLNAKAVYLPARLSGGRPRALIPLRGDAPLPAVAGPLADRLIVDFGPQPEDVGLLVATPGTAVAELLETSPGSRSADLEAALAHAVVGMLDAAARVYVAREDGAVKVTLLGVRLNPPDLWVYRSVGTPLASVVATLVAEGLDRPVTISSEAQDGNRVTVWLEAADGQAAGEEVGV
ncbi:MAG: hypothetical protein QN175_12420 [Armatimonadota bacterium]|nr:hypothetical protein [Armatimonadota bacterium]